ncbi:MAG: hypothetical protein HYV35_10415 [Lentisphaerae bacterium]|nr:hypothetical protein [Lentisphaerota bacterium]
MLINGATWGGATYFPVAGDYDGDGKADLSVFSRIASKWYTYHLGDNTTREINIGFDEFFVPIVYWPLYFYY